MEQRFCTNCGTALANDAPACPACGAPIAPPAPQPTAPPQQPYEQQMPNQGQVPPQYTQTPPQGQYGQVPPQGVPPYQQPIPPQYAPVPPGYQPKSKVVAGVLAILIGSLGIHNFYLGYTNKGLIQLLVSVLTCGIAATAMWIWAIVEGVQILNGTIAVDAKGVPLKD